MARPESIENRWDILYRDYPEVYEAFSSIPYHPTVMEQLPQIIDLKGKLVADIGAGTGKSTLGLARYAGQVIGIEYEPAMLRVAREKAAAEKEALPERRVTFLCGDALAMPLAEDSVDVVTAITLALYPPEQYRGFIREGLRAARGPVLYVGIAPGWYGGDLCAVIEDDEKVDDQVDRIFREEFHFAYRDIVSVQDYGTLDRITCIYGFIFGRKAIEHLKREQKTTITWTFRVYWRS